jgi:futalosine hydrolase
VSALLVVTAVPVERAAVAGAIGADELIRIGPYEALHGSAGGPEVTVLAGGVGPAAAAAATATALCLAPTPMGYALVVSAGIGGGFRGRAALGEVVEATTIVAADLGVGLPTGFRPIADFGFGIVEVAAEPLGIAGARRGPVLTVSTVTGTAERAAELAGRGGYGEAMEGFGVAEVAARYGLPVGEMRAISNQVGDRDRAGWDIPGALAALAVAARTLPEVLG